MVRGEGVLGINLDGRIFDHLILGEVRKSKNGGRK